MGRTAGAVIAGCTGPLQSVSWQQTGGPPVTLMSARTQAISFDPVTAGTYSFSVSFVDSTGTQRTASTSISATTAGTVGVVARGDQAVRMGGSVSVRAYPTIASGETVTWTQTAGPRVTLDTSDPNRIIFTAPTVTQDTALVFRVTRTSASGADSDDVMVLVEHYIQAPPDPSNTGPYIFSGLHVSRVYPYKSTGPYAGVMVACVYNAQLQYTGTATNTCPLATLPYLDQDTHGSVPTVAQVMDRVLVSHDWMGKAFEELLTANQNNADLMRLFNGITAVIIGAHVRPSLYYVLTGAIHLDAEHFWRTADERDVIDEAPDFRSDFGRDLQFSGLWRYTANNQSIFLPFPRSSRISRDVGYLMQESGWLLYHELGHASDFLPITARGALNPALSPWGNISPRYQARLLASDLLASNFPLASAQMRALAQVLFTTGPVDDATLVNGIPYATLKTYTPNDVAGFFAADLATDEYNYHVNTREDIAMTFEETMMARIHGWRRDIAFTDKVTASSTGNTVIVRWGQRGRVGDPNIKPRAQFVVSQLAPWVNLADVAALPAPIQMRPGDTWNGNLVLPAPPSGLASAQAFTGPRLTTEEEQIMLRRALAREGIGISGPAVTHSTLNERWLKRIQR